MKRVSLYSRSNRGRTRTTATHSGHQARPAETTTSETAAPQKGWWHRFYGRHDRVALAIGSGVFTLIAIFGYAYIVTPFSLTQKDIDLAVLHSLENMPAKFSMASKAYQVIRPSVVRVRAYSKGDGDEEEKSEGTGTGVVIVETGIILTNLHVVGSAHSLKVTFFDGSVSEADVTSVQPENDLAVLQAKTVPDDLIPATMSSTAELALGDNVIAVGFPFDIGPSVSSGVVSGLKREYRNPEGKRVLSNLIQFDAAANPGNSGGPLVTANGEVVGIVTGILNPSDQRVFIGIGFAVPIESAASAAGMSPF
jgi:S1-C subfamily serine protease